MPRAKLQVIVFIAGHNIYYLKPGTIKKMCDKKIAFSRFKVAAASFEAHID